MNHTAAHSLSPAAGQGEENQKGKNEKTIGLGYEQLNN